MELVGACGRGARSRGFVSVFATLSKNLRSYPQKLVPLVLATNFVCSGSYDARVQRYCFRFDDELKGGKKWIYDETNDPAAKNHFVNLPS